MEHQRGKHYRRDRRRHGDCPFSYLGVETVAVAAGKVRNPDRISRRPPCWAQSPAIVYMLLLTVVFGIVPTTQLADASAPVSDAVNAMSGGTWAGNPMAIAVIISGFGALDGQANRRDHLVDRPGKAEAACSQES